MTHQIDISNLFNPTTEESWLYKEYKKQTMAQQTPQEKAKQLVDSFMDLSEEQEYNTPRYMPKEMAKQCALIAVDEIIKYSPNKPVYEIDPIGYFQKVKQEIQNI